MPQVEISGEVAALRRHVAVLVIVARGLAVGPSVQPVAPVRPVGLHNRISVGHVPPIDGQDRDAYAGRPSLVRAAGDRRALCPSASVTSELTGPAA